MAKVFANALLTDLPSRSEDEPERTHPAWATDAFASATMLFVFIGASTVSKWIWSTRAVAFVVTLAALAAWATGAFKLGVLKRRSGKFGWRDLVIGFVVDAVFFSSFMLTADVLWFPRPIAESIIFACSVGVAWSFFRIGSKV